MVPALAWWKLLSLAAVLNIALWGLTWQLVEPEPQRQILLWLAGVYVAGCAFRSFLPMLDVQRYCLHQTPVSRIFVGRSVATVAELAFAAQWAVLLHEAGAHRAAWVVLALIALAEVLSWLAVLARNDLFHAAENSLWTLAAAIGAGFLASRWAHQAESGRAVIVMAAACAAAYIAFMLVYVVPMYVRRWREGNNAFGFADGLRSSLALCTVERSWALWWRDALWLTPYFTVCVWLSLALPHVPRL